MSACHLPPWPKVVILAALVAAGAAYTRPAAAQIFGTVGADGAIVLSNSAGNPALRLIVAANVAVERRVKNGNATGALTDSSQLSAIISEASQTSQVPPELLKAVIAVESRYNPNAVSRKGARGLMQLMPDTARRFSAGDMLDPRENVLAGAQYLRFLLDMFKGDLELVLAAYNAGEHAVVRAGFRIPAFAETQSYVPAVLAQYRRFLAPA